MPAIIALFFVIAIINAIYIYNYKVIRNFIIRRKVKNKDISIERDIDVEYSPSIVSYLHNQKIEPIKDLTADILNLYAKKIILIEKNNSKESNIILNQKGYNDIKNELYDNDKYIIETLFLKEEKFDYEIWVNRIIKVYREKINIKKIKEISFAKALTIFLFIPLAVFFVMVIIRFITKNGMYSLIGFYLAFLLGFGSMIGYLAANRDENKDAHLSKDAKKELAKWIKIGNFIKDYTLLKDRNYEEIVIYEQYLPFAMVLNINKKYTKEIKKILEKDEIKLIIDSIREYQISNNIFKQYNNIN